MSEPKHWLDQGAPRDIERLVRAARAEQPSRASLARSLSAVGVGVTATSVAAGAKAAGTAATLGGAAKATVPVTGSVLAKWTVIGATVTTLAVGGAKVATDALQAVSSSPASVPQPVGHRAVPIRVSAPDRRGSPAPSRVVVPPEVTGPAVASDASSSPTAAAPPPRRGTAEDATALGGPRPPLPAPASSAMLDAETLAKEVKSIDRARAALAAGQPAQTLAVLDDYESRFRKRGFAPEALFLRMEAYRSLGRTEESRSVAERLLATYPNSLHGARARAVLSKSP